MQDSQPSHRCETYWDKHSKIYRLPGNARLLSVICDHGTGSQSAHIVCFESESEDEACALWKAETEVLWGAPVGIWLVPQGYPSLLVRRCHGAEDAA